MKVAVAGGLGFLGRYVVSALSEAGHDVTVFARRDEPLMRGISLVKADLMESGDWQGILAGHDAVINLVGVNLFRRWNKKIKKMIYDSRVTATANIIDSFNTGNSSVKTLINASAVGYYGLKGDDILTESSGPGRDFLAEVCRDWEKTAMKGEEKGVRTVLLRFGSVFGKDGGAFPVLAKNFKLMLGGKLGSGRQWFPWIHIDDINGIVLKAVTDSKMSGPYNCTAPGIVTNGEFTKTMARSVKRPVVVPFVPGFVLRIVLGEFGSYLTGGQRALPVKLQKEGYRFMFPDLEGALKDLLK